MKILLLKTESREERIKITQQRNQTIIYRNSSSFGSQISAASDFFIKFQFYPSELRFHPQQRGENNSTKKFEKRINTVALHIDC